MLFTPFCACLVLSLLTILFDLRTGRLLRRGMQTREKRSILAWWPLSIIAHVVLLYVVASAPLIHKGTVREMPALSQGVPGSTFPSAPRSSIEWKKSRVEYL
jgi:hypothetical protein